MFRLLFLGFNAPTKPPPTIPIKHEGPQAIPAPDNIPTSELHEIFQEKYQDTNGHEVTSTHETIKPSTEGNSNPGVAMVPHAIPLSNFESHDPFRDSFHGTVSSISNSHFSPTNFSRILGIWF